MLTSRMRNTAVVKGDFRSLTTMTAENTPSYVGTSRGRRFYIVYLYLGPAYIPIKRVNDLTHQTS